MTIDEARRAILSIPIGRSRVVNGHVLTAWSSNVVDIGTWGRATDDLDHAAKWIASNPA